jgi:hypothetical protein
MPVVHELSDLMPVFGRQRDRVELDGCDAYAFD